MKFREAERVGGKKADEIRCQNAGYHGNGIQTNGTHVEKVTRERKKAPTSCIDSISLFSLILV